MAIYTIDLELDNNQKNMVKDLYKYIVLFIVFHILSNSIEIKDYGIISGNLFNVNFVTFLLIVAISIIAYYTVALEIVEFI